MKPTVITSSGSNENPQNHPTGSNINPTGNNIGPNNGSGGTSNANAHANARQFPQFQTGFTFDPDDDDIFLDAGLRSRLNRFRDPFSFARKRCGNTDSNTDPYSRYFEDDTDFFPDFGSFPSRRRAAAPSGNSSNSNQIFDSIPSEFRHYIPEGFGFQHGRTAPPQQPQPATQQQRAHPQEQHPYPPKPQFHPQQQYHETYVQPPSPTYTQPPQQKPKLCDAAIQTEDLSEPQNETKDPKILKQYGMRNTVDLGQKSPPEECRGSRSQSAPPADGPEQNSSSYSHASNAGPEGGAFATATAYANASAAATSPQTNEPQQAFNQQRSQGTQPMTPPHPPPRQHGVNSQQQYQPWNQQHQQQYQQPPPQQQESNTQSGGGFVRTVPIIIEGRSEPTVNKTKAPAAQQQNQQTKQKPAHPTPLNTQQTIPPNTQAPPQTPQTTECINKIQDIQRDVLALMSKVEHFKGLKNDKHYMYLDEMLTRNLLKLDTIDTNGKDSIRLARREAIKCIQASINVLEAKSEENARAAQQTGMDEVEQKAEEGATDNTSSKNAESEECVNRPPENIAIPLPPPPEKKQDQTVEPSTMEATEEVVPVVSNSEKVEDISKTEHIEKCGTASNPNASAEPSIESAAKGAEDKESSTKAEISDNVSPKISEAINDSEGVKASGGAVKKKIIKKKKPATDKKDKTSKSESVSPDEKPPEDPKSTTPGGSEGTEQKSEKAP